MNILVIVEFCPKYYLTRKIAETFDILRCDFEHAIQDYQFFSTLNF